MNQNQIVKMNQNQIVRQDILGILSKARYPVNSRKLCKVVSHRNRVKAAKVWGNISFLKRSQALTFKVRRKGGPSYVV